MQVSRLLIRSVSSQLRQCRSARLISTTNVLEMPLKRGDKLPQVDLFEHNPSKKVNTSELCKGKVVIFGVPGAFTPTCSKEHAPGFINMYCDLKAKGVTSVVCISVNDPFVMDAWHQSLDAGQKVRFLADTCGEFVKKADLAVDLTAVLGNVRSKRFALVVEDGVVMGIQVEPDGTALTCSRADDVLKLLSYPLDPGRPDAEKKKPPAGCCAQTHGCPPDCPH